MNIPALFKSNYTGTCIQHPHKVTEFGCTPSCCICWNNLLEKLHCLLRLPILHIFNKLLIPCKNVHLHCAWCQCSHLCCHPWWVLLVMKPECFLCLLMLEIWVPPICLQPEIQIELISHVFSASQA
jgi:hypothetical protein